MAVLVQLRAESHRIDELTRAKQYALVEEVKKDREKVNQATINDFTDHFDYCPVYYFMDTNYEKIKEKQFAGILINADGSSISNYVVNNNNHYLIASYGKPYFQSRFAKKVEDSIDNTYMSDIPYDRAIIICNEDLIQVGYFYKLNYVSRYHIKQWGKKYYYHSKRFKIEYCPAAKSFNDALYKNPYHIPVREI